MQRTLIKSLVDWKNSPSRKPLILNGARQVGKTWLLKAFGNQEFNNMAYVSLDNNAPARGLFEQDYEVSRIIDGLGLLTGQKIIPGETLIVLDEIQEAPKALTSLKYFCENAPEYAVAAAGSLLGLSAHEGTGYPVGKVNTLDLNPMSFLEFLDATGEDELARLVRSGDHGFMALMKDRLIDALKRYYVVGGMPEAVLGYARTRELGSAREIQQQILRDYSRDFSKHASARILPRMLEAWGSIPAHLSQENKKFIFGRVREGARAKDYEESLIWLEQAGLVRRVSQVTKPGLPLKAYVDWKAFKVFMLDVGLLGALAGLEPKSVLEGSRVFTEFKGALTEQYVCQELLASCGLEPFYWSAENSRGEIDFLIQQDGAVYPLEVKAEENLRAKSLRLMGEKYPEARCRRFSLSDFREEDWMRNVPLYAVSNTDCWL